MKQDFTRRAVLAQTIGLGTAVAGMGIWARIRKSPSFASARRCHAGDVHVRLNRHGGDRLGERQ